MVVIAADFCVFAYLWTHNGPHQLSTRTAYERFRSGANSQFVDPGTLRPHEGVYSYVGVAKEHISLPPKTQVEGPGMPGTVTYDRSGCWVWRMDHSDAHWQSSTYCARNGNLVLTGRAGWYRWDFVMLTIADTATFKCAPGVTLPKLLRPGERFALSCKGTNEPINTGVVHMTGYNRYVGVSSPTIVGTSTLTANGSFRLTSLEPVY